MFHHTLTSAHEITLGAYPLQRVASLTLSSDAGMSDAKRVDQLARTYQPINLTVSAAAAAAAAAPAIDLTPFASVHRLHLACVTRAPVTVRCPSKVSHLEIGPRVELDAKSELSLRDVSVVLHHTTLSAAKQVGTRPKRVEFHGASTRDAQVDIQQVLLNGQSVQVIVHPVAADLAAFTPWVHVSADLKLMPAAGHEIIEFGGSLNASLGFLTSRTFTALQYSKLKHMSLAVSLGGGTGFYGTLARLFEFTSLLHATAFELSYFEVRATSLDTGVAAILASQLLGRLIKAEKAGKPLLAISSLVLVIPDPNEHARTSKEVISLLSLFQRRSADERKDHMLRLAGDPKNKAVLQMYLDVGEWVGVSPLPPNELHHVITHHSYDAEAARRAINAIFAAPKHEVGTHVHAESDTNTFCVTSPNNTSAEHRVCVEVRLKL